MITLLAKKKIKSQEENEHLDRFQFNDERDRLILRDNL
jgi:hypothetical protein